jgi:hypothetical protein
MDLLATLPPRLWVSADGARWFLGTMIRKGMYGHVGADGYARLRGEIARDIVGRRTWPGLRDALVDGGVVEVSPHIGGQRCRGYRLTDALGGEPCRTRLREPCLVERLNRFRDGWEQAQDSRLLPIHRRLRQIQRQHVTVAPEVDAALDELEGVAHLVQAALVRAIRERRAGFSVSGTARVFNCVTGMKRALRQHVRIDGEPVVEVDIRGAQPALLGLICTPNGPKGAPSYIMYPGSPLLPAGCPVYSVSLDSPSHTRSQVASRVDGLLRHLPALTAELGSYAAEFAALAIDGCMYESLLESYLLRGLSVPHCKDGRSWVKLRFLVDVLNHHPSDLPLRPLVRIVLQRWPSVYRFIAAANRNYRGTLIATLQRLESALVVERVAPLLVDRFPVLTLHDSIVCRRRDRPLVVAAFDDVFSMLGVQLKLKED